MKKIVRFLLILVLLIAAVVVVAGVMAPKEMNVTSTTSINAPTDQVWDQMVKFKNTRNWSPWVEKEPTVEIDYTGTDGEQGSTYHWGGKETGEGTMTNKGIENGVMTYQLDFVKPFVGTADGTMKAEDAGNGMTKATWTFHSADGFIMRAMGYIMGAQKMLQSDFDKGMQNLKTYMEAHKVEKPAITVQETQFAAHTYAGVRKVVKEGEYQTAFNEVMGKVKETASARISGPYVSIIYKWDPATHESDMFAGFPLSDDKPVEGATLVKVPASRAYMVTYTGNPMGTEAAHDAIRAHMAAKNETETLMLEEYVTSPTDEKEMDKGVTNVIYLVK